MPLARLRQWPALLVIVALVALAGCQPVRPVLQAKFEGAVVGDEAQAMLAARGALAAGGSAADAAVALTFALAATYPSVASLGGGGQCLVYLPGKDNDTIQALDFLPGHAGTPEGSGSAIAVPGTVRGMDALQERFGRLQWSRTLFAAENLAQFGHPVSRAFADDLAIGGDALISDPAARAIFARSDGRVYARSRTIIQRDLAALLEQLRVAGAADFYTGRTARLLVDAVARAGGTLTSDDLAGYQAHWRGTVSLTAGNQELHTVSGSGGAVAAAIWGLAGAAGHYAEAENAKRYRLLVEAALSSFAHAPIAAEVVLKREALADAISDEGTEEVALSEGGASSGLGNVRTTSFAIVDRNGMAVACGLTMNGLFGAGWLAPGTGIILAAPSKPNLAPPIAPVVLVGRDSRQLLVAAGGGGGAAPSALAATLLAVIDGGRSLDEAVVAPRVHHDGASDRLLVEPVIAAAVRAELDAMGHRVFEVPVLGRVNGIHCPEGVSRDPRSCRTVSDRRRYVVSPGEIP